MKTLEQFKYWEISEKYETLANFGDALVYIIINLLYSYHHGDLQCYELSSTQCHALSIRTFYTLARLG